jgi:phytoene synthase
MEQMEEGTAADFPAQVAAASLLHGAIADLETAWWFGDKASSDQASRTATLSHLLYSLLRLEEDADRDRLALPMSRLAKFGLSRNQLREATDSRTDAIRAQLEDLHGAWREADRLSGPMSAFRGLESRHGRALVAKARKAADPLDVLRKGQGKQGPGVTWQAWLAARGWRREVD